MQLVVRGVRRPIQLEGALAIQDGADPSEEKVFRAHAPPRGACASCVCSETAG